MFIISYKTISLFNFSISMTSFVILAISQTFYCLESANHSCTVNQFAKLVTIQKYNSLALWTVGLEHPTSHTYS